MAKSVKKKSPNQQILDNQKAILKKLEILDEIKEEVEKELAQEQFIESEEEQEISELEKLEALEKKIEKDVKVNPLQKITYRDFSRSCIGAFLGILGHFAFFYGVKIAHDISTARATVLYIVAFIIGAIFLYFTGFRKFDKKHFTTIAPIRLMVIYLTSIVIILIVLLLFNFINFQTPFIEIYKSVSAISILAVMGAVTADLIGKE